MNDYEHVKMKVKHWNIGFLVITTIYMIAFFYEVFMGMISGGGPFTGATEGKIITTCIAPAMMGVIVNSALLVKLASQNVDKSSFLSTFKKILVSRQLCCIFIDCILVYIGASFIFHTVKFTECGKNLDKKADCETLYLVYMVMDGVYFTPTSMMTLIQITILNIDSYEINKLNYPSSTKAQLIDQKDEWAIFIKKSTIEMIKELRIFKML